MSIWRQDVGRCAIVTVYRVIVLSSIVKNSFRVNCDTLLSTYTVQITDFCLNKVWYVNYFSTTSNTSTLSLILSIDLAGRFVMDFGTIFNQINTTPTRPRFYVLALAWFKSGLNRISQKGCSGVLVFTSTLGVINGDWRTNAWTYNSEINRQVNKAWQIRALYGSTETAGRRETGSCKRESVSFY